MVAVCLVLLLGIAGLVIDAGLAYLVKARLNAAVDAAAVAGARAVTSGDTEPQQRLSAQTAAQEFFDANIPRNYLLSTPVLTVKKVTFNAGEVTVDTKAEALMPVSLMQVMGFTSMTPVASAQTIRRDLDMAFVVDDSGSLKPSAAAVRAAAKSFLEKFNVTQDRVALIRFGSGAQIDKAIKTSGRGFDRDAMLDKIATYDFGGNTSSVEGMWHAREQLKSIAPLNRSSLRVIVFFSDGEPTSLGGLVKFSNGICKDIPGVITNESTGLFDLNSSKQKSILGCKIDASRGISVTTLPKWYNAHGANDQEFAVVTDTPRVVKADLTGSQKIRGLDPNIDRAARNLAEAVAAKAREEGIFVYTLGLGASLKTGTGVDLEKGEDVLKCMANVADGPARCYNPAERVGMYCHAATQADLTPCFSRLASAILRISK